MTSKRVRAIRFEQNSRVFYATVLRAIDLIEASKVDTWDPDNKQDEGAGYQRAPSKTRIREMAHYVEREDAIVPMGGLANARSQEEGSTYGQVMHFDPDPGQNDVAATGWLTLSEDVLPLYVVDMQHRLGGIEHAIEEDERKDLRDFPILVTIADGLSRVEEMEQFEIINTTMKKVPTDLARRLMSIQAQDSERRLGMDRRGRLWEARGPIVADWLNKNGFVWKGRIIPPNKSKSETPKGIVRETSFVTSLKPILNSPFFQRMTEEQVATVIDRYWTAIEGVWPTAFGYPGENVIQKTPGVFSLHAVAPEIVELVRSGGHDLSTDAIREVIAPWAGLGEDYWAAGNEEGAAKYGSMKGFSRLAADLRDVLPSLELSL